MKFVRDPVRKVTFKRRPKRKVSPSKKKASAVAPVKATERQPSRDPFFYGMVACGGGETSGASA